MTLHDRRGDGVGIELTATGLRGVRLDADTVGRIAMCAVVSCNPADDLALHDAFFQLHAALDARELPTVVTSWPTGARLQSIDVTASTDVERRGLRFRAGQVGYRSVFSFARAAHQVMTFSTVPIEEHERIIRLVSGAGFRAVNAEFSPVSLARLAVTGDWSLVVQRAKGESWCVLSSQGVASVAVSTDSQKRSDDQIVARQWHTIDDRHRALTAETTLHELVNFYLDASNHDRSPKTSKSPELPLHLIEGPYPDFPESHPSWPPRMAVAVGAAVSAAGLGGRFLKPESVAVTARVREDEAVWVFERVDETRSPAAR